MKNLIKLIKDSLTKQDINDKCQFKDYNMTDCKRCSGYKTSCAIYLSANWLKKFDIKVKERDKENKENYT